MGTQSSTMLPTKTQNAKFMHLKRMNLPMLKPCTAPAGQTRHVTCCAAQRLVALDFDGVICDSVGESSLSAIKAAKKLWPQIFDTPAAEARKDELVEGMRGVRPVVETGYENIVQIRALYEGMTVKVRVLGTSTMMT